MTTSKRIFTLATLLVLALVSYGYGFTQSATAIVFLGLAFEGTFWVGLFSNNKSKS